MEKIVYAYISDARRSPIHSQLISNRNRTKNEQESKTIKRCHNILRDEKYVSLLKGDMKKNSTKRILAWVYVINEGTQLQNNDLSALILDYIKTFDFEINCYHLFENEIGSYDVSEIFIINKDGKRLLTSISGIPLDLNLYIESKSEPIPSISSFGKDCLLVNNTFKTCKLSKILLSRYNLHI
jgi:hypothetical protein